MAELQSLYLAPSCEVCMRPSPEFGISSYHGKEEMMAEACAFAFGPDGYMTKLNQLDIEGRWELAPGVTKTRYSDGTEITVNLGQGTVNADHSCAERSPQHLGSLP
jgi:hypothetical protein